MDALSSSVYSEDSISDTSITEIPGIETSNSRRSRAKLNKAVKQGISPIFKGKKWKQNKISKDDYCSKTSEFRMWLMEEKQINLDEIAPGKAKELFKKFVKKWNGKKLTQKYYGGADPMWSAASPSTYARQCIPDEYSDQNLGTSTPRSGSPRKSDSHFSTFGKKRGRKMRLLLEEAENIPVFPELPHPEDGCWIEPATATQQQQHYNIMQKNMQNPRSGKNSSRSCLSVTQELWQTDVALRSATLGREGGTCKSVKPVQLPDAPDMSYKSCQSLSSARSKSTSQEQVYMAFGPRVSQVSASLPTIPQQRPYSVAYEDEYMSFGPRLRVPGVSSNLYASIRTKPPPPPRSASIKQLPSEEAASTLPRQPSTSSTCTYGSSCGDDPLYATIGGPVTRSMVADMHTPYTRGAAHSDTALNQAVPSTQGPPVRRVTVSRSDSCIRPSTTNSSSGQYATIKRRHTLLASKSDTNIQNVDLNSKDVLRNSIRIRAYSESNKSKSASVNFRNSGTTASLMGPPQIPAKNPGDAKNAMILREKSQSLFRRKRPSSETLRRGNKNKKVLRRNSSGGLSIPTYV